jgi:hypothetical protein
MKKLLTVLVSIFAFAGLSFAQTQTPPAATPAKAPSVSQTVKQLEHDWVDAGKTGDTDKLGQILADIGSSSIPTAPKERRRVIWQT